MLRNYKTITKLVLAISLTSLSYSSLQAYKASITPSIYEAGANQLGFNGYSNKDCTISTATQQESILKILYMSGSLNPQNLWQDLHKMTGFKDPAAVFKNIYSILIKAGTDQTDLSKFKAKLLRKNLFNDSSLTTEDSKDLLLYLAQNAFARKIGVERSELTAQDWMHKYSTEYLSAANDLNLTGRHYPNYAVYNEAWILGASRIGILTRLADFKYLLSLNKFTITGDTKILAGKRELWAEIDGIEPNTLKKLTQVISTSGNIDDMAVHLASQNNQDNQDNARLIEGQDYMRSLANKSGIALSAEHEFIKYSSQVEAIAGRYPGRTYANYANYQNDKLTETLVAQDLIKEILGNQPNIHIIDTLSENNSRPTTSSTARDAAEIFIQKILAGDFKQQKEFTIIVQSNNPYTERQKIDVQRQINLALKNAKLDQQGYKITADGVGFSNKQDVAAINSEFAILVAEKWKLANENNQITTNTNDHRLANNLMFQTRKHDVTVPEYPENLATGFNLTGHIKHIFDELLD